jgi:hypothetical protein
MIKPFLNLSSFDLQKHLTVGLYLLYNTIMKTQERRPICAIRMKPDILQQGRVAAVTQKKTLGQWLEEAIAEKIERDQKLSKEGQG